MGRQEIMTDENEDDAHTAERACTPGENIARKVALLRPLLPAVQLSEAEWRRLVQLMGLDELEDAALVGMVLELRQRLVACPGWAAQCRARGWALVRSGLLSEWVWPGDASLGPPVFE